MVVRTGKWNYFKKEIREASRKPTTTTNPLKVYKPYLIEVCQSILELLRFRGEHWSLRGRDEIIIIFMMRGCHS